MHLYSKKLSKANCYPLIQHVKYKINTWSTKSWSFAGRLLLLSTVIAGISHIWCSTFVLPKFCIKTINSLCEAYLWRGTTEKHHTPRVSWDLVTYPKKKGGLGCRIYTWNRACTFKLLWLLLCNYGSIWVAWYKKSSAVG